MLHKGTPAPSPEALMRSRYTAYALNKVDYIMATTHPDSPYIQTDVGAWRRELEFFATRTRFAGLQILAVASDTEGETVTFRATLFAGDEDVSFTEKSLFAKHDGRWMYHSGENPAKA
jgi:SEC-C motif domain protein